MDQPLDLDRASARVLAYLNLLLAHDPKATTRLFTTKVKFKSFPNLPFISLGDQVGALGVLNGVLRGLGLPVHAAWYKEDGLLGGWLQLTEEDLQEILKGAEGTGGLPAKRGRPRTTPRPLTPEEVEQLTRLNAKYHRVRRQGQALKGEELKRFKDLSSRKRRADYQAQTPK